MHHLRSNIENCNDVPQPSIAQDTRIVRRCRLNRADANVLRDFKYHVKVIDKEYFVANGDAESRGYRVALDIPSDHIVSAY